MTTPKKNSKFAEVRALHQHPRCTLVSNDNVAYDYYNAEIMIIESGGTSLPEAMWYNPKTIRAQFLNHHNIFGMDEFPLLMQARTPEKLQEYLETLKHNPENILTDKYELQRQQFIHNYYLAPEKLSYPQIYDEILQLPSIKEKFNATSEHDEDGEEAANPQDSN